MSHAPSGVHTWLILWKATRAVEARAHESIEENGLRATDFAILEALLHKGPMPVNTIGRKLLLTSGSITTAVDRLVAKGLVARGEDPDDRRLRGVQLTREGRPPIDPALARDAK